MSARDAGLALACPYSSSEEFEAAVIAARYADSDPPRAVLNATLTIAAAVIFLMI